MSTPTCAEIVCDCCGPCRCEDPSTCNGNCAPLMCDAPAKGLVYDGDNPPWPVCGFHASERSDARLATDAEIERACAGESAP